jgi:hypothetical protein
MFHAYLSSNPWITLAKNEDIHVFIVYMVIDFDLINDMNIDHL